MMMQCPSCGLLLPASDFDRSHKTATGYTVWCSDCLRARRKRYADDLDASQARNSMTKYKGGWDRVEAISEEAREHGMSYGKWKAYLRGKSENGI